MADGGGRAPAAEPEPPARLRKPTPTAHAAATEAKVATAAIPASTNRRDCAQSDTLGTRPRLLLDPGQQHAPPHVAMITLEERWKSSHRQLQRDVEEIRRAHIAFSASIKRRNKRVELDKEWETSLVRGAIIMGCTYGLLGL